MATGKLERSFIMIVACIIINSMASCKDEVINIKSHDDLNYKIAGINAVIKGQDGKTEISNYDFQKEGNFKLSLLLNKPFQSETNVNFEYDESVLNLYNQNNGTSFKPYPKELISFENNGNLNIKTDISLSDNITIKIKENTAASPDDVFVLPVKAKSQSLQESKNLQHLIFIKDLTKGASAAKSNGIKVFSIIEANNVNPLMHLAFTLKNSGKPLFDYVVLFSSNINYNKETGKVYLSHNENCTHILENRDKYIKPLQDKGIKVALSILGNHDLSGIANLSDETIKYFAQEIKKTCETYGLDGVFYDDEYSKYEQATGVPGFVTPSNARAAKLIYEVKRIMPTTTNMAYVYSRTHSFGAGRYWWEGFQGINEAQAGAYVDYAIHDYGNSYDLSQYYPGLPKSGMIMFSSEHALDRYSSSSNLKTIVTNGYGGTMVFSLNPHYNNFSRAQMNNLKNIANSLYGDELVYDETKAPKKDW